MTETEHLELYKEIKKIILHRSPFRESWSDAQKYSAEGFEAAAFQVDFIEIYAELVQRVPDIELKNFHAFCVGYALGQRLGREVTKNENKTNH